MMFDQKKAYDFLIRLLSVPSVNGKDDESEIALCIRDYFQQHGISSVIHPIDEKHANVSAFLPGTDNKRTVIWNGHLDTVPYGDLSEWVSDPAVPAEKDGRIFARGASDMKSGLAAMVCALCHLEGKPVCNVLFIGTCDEEKNGLGAEAVLKDHMITEGAKLLLIGEPTALHPGTAQKGCLWLQLEIKGRTSHGAYPEKGTNAIECGMRIADMVSAFVKGYHHPLLGRSTAQVTCIEGGIASNMTPDRCKIIMDIRMVPPLRAEDVLRAAETALEQQKAHKPDLEAGFVCLNNRRAIEIDETHPFVKNLQQEIRRLDHDDTPIGINFFTDASILDRSGVMDICLFGPGDPAMAHQPDESVEVSKYLDAIRILQNLLRSGL